MGYAGAGLGFGLQQGFAGLGATLMGISDRQEQRAANEAAARMQKERWDAEQQYRDDTFTRAGQWHDEEVARLDANTARDETIRRGEAFKGAMDEANTMVSRGQNAFVNPGKVYFSGSPLDGTLEQHQTLQAESGIPTVEAGAYDPGENPSNQDIKWQGDYFTGKGYGVEGQLPPRPTPEKPDGARDERRSGWIKRLGTPVSVEQQETLDALAEGVVSPEQVIAQLPQLVQSGVYTPDQAEAIKQYLSAGEGGEIDFGSPEALANKYIGGR